MNKSEKAALINAVRRKYRDIGESFTEQQRRIWTAAEAREIGRGGVSYVHEATGVSRSVISAGMQEIMNIKKKDTTSCRKAGGGRKRLNRI